MNDLDRMCTTYGYELDLAVKEHDLPRELFNAPDHVAFKTYDSDGFDDFLNRLRGMAEELSYVRMDNRRIAAAWFAAPIAVKKFGEVHWLEVMEPRPKNVGMDIVGVEHMEFHYPDLDKTRQLLKNKGLPLIFESNFSHSWLSGIINGDLGLEVKFSDRKLSDIVAEGIKSGQAVVL